LGLSSHGAEIKFGRSLSDEAVDPRESLMIFGASGYHLGIMTGADCHLELDGCIEEVILK
jgi:hypothetical protein